MEIGSRVAGSPALDEAATYAAQQFASWGYEVELQEFTAEGFGTLRYSTVIAEGAPAVIDAVSFGGSAAGAVSGRLLDAGPGMPEDIPTDAGGSILLFQRQDVPFADMAARAEAAGAAGMIVANKEPELFPGQIEPATTLHAVAIDQEQGEALRARLADGTFDVTLEVRESVTAQNVVARPESGSCRTISGGHYDSVSWAAGAYDNASGSALVLELARTAAAAGLTGHCFVLFSAEELGLVGSAFMVSEFSAAEVESLEAMYNYDASAGFAPPFLIGTPELTEEARTLASDLSIEASITTLPENASSDHASFLEAGIPALMLTAEDTGLLHTPQDTFENMLQESLAPLLELGFGLLQARP